MPELSGLFDGVKYSVHRGGMFFDMMRNQSLRGDLDTILCAYLPCMIPHLGMPPLCAGVSRVFPEIHNQR